MVAIFAGSGTGLENGSGAALGGAGLLDQSSLGRAGEQLFFNAANGNLVIRGRDEFLVGKGPDIGISRTYNSLGQWDGDNGDNWQQSTSRRVHSFTGDTNTWTGGTLKRTSGDGSDIEYTWDSGENAYVATNGAGAHDRISYDTASSTWTWTDGDSQYIETYEDIAAGGSEWLITEHADTDGNTLTFTYDANTNRLEKVATADGDYSEYSYDGSGNITQITTSYTDLAAAGTPTKALVRTSYAYDNDDRLVSVTTDLTTDITNDSETYVTNYTYDGTSNRIASVSQTDGSSLAITYDAQERVASLTQTVVGGTTPETRTTTVTYDSVNGITTVTDAVGNDIHLYYDGQERLVQIITPPAYDGALSRMVQFEYDGDGNLIRSIESEVNAGSTPITFLSTGRGDNKIVSTDSWPSDESQIVDGTGLAGWSGWNLSETRWKNTSGPYGSGTQVSLNLGNPSGTGSAGGVIHTDDFVIDETKSYEFTYYFKKEPGPVDHDLQFAIKSSSAGAEQVLNNANGVAAVHAQFARLTKGQQDALEDDRWYKFVGYVLGSSASNTAGHNVHGGLFDTTDGSKVSGITVQSYRWKAGVDGQMAASRFIGVSATTTSGEDSYDTHIFKPEVRQMQDDAYIISTNNPLTSGTVDFDVVADQTLFLNPNGTSASGDEARATYYTYDQSGQLLERRLAGQTATETFTYDGMGRTRTSTDLNGGATNIVFNDAADSGGQTTTVIELASGLTRTSTYNSGGELISEFLSDGTTPEPAASYEYDDRGLLRMATETLGNKSHSLYDDAGRKVADIAADGSLTEYHYDVSGRLVATTAYNGKLTQQQLDGLVDSNGDPVDTDLSTIRPTADAQDQWNWTVYDDADRIIQAIDGGGSVVAFEYDGAGRLIKTTSYATDVEADAITTNDLADLRINLPASAVAVEANAAIDSVSRNFYDADGRLVAVLDGEGYLTESIYDEAERLLETIAYAGATDVNDRVSGDLAALKAGLASVTTEDRHSYSIYNDRGVLQYAANHGGQLSEYFYDGNGRQLRSLVYATALSQPSDYSFATIDGLAAAARSDAANISSWSVYDDVGRLSYAIDAENNVSAFAYDSSGRITKTVQYAAQRVTASSPSNGDMVNWATSEAGNADNRISYNIYNEKDELLYSVDGEGYVTENSYDEEGQLTLTKRWDNPVSTSGWPTDPQASDVTNELLGSFSQTSFTYDDNGRLERSTNAAGIHTDYTYYGTGEVKQEIQAAEITGEERIIEYTYDGAGRVITETWNPGHTADEITLSYAYDGFGSRIASTDGNGNVTTYEYDRLGRLTKETWPSAGGSSLEVQTAYDGLGQVISQTAPNGSVTSFSYDSLGRLVGETRPEGAGATYGYNHFGDLKQSTDAELNNSYNYYDKLGRITLSVDAEGNATSTSYNSFGQVESITRHVNPDNGNIDPDVLPAITPDAIDDTVTSFTYDEIGRLVSEMRSISDSENAVTLFEYDADGNLVKSTDANGMDSFNYYDDAGRLTLSIDAEGYAVSTSYTGNNEAAAVTRYANQVHGTAAVGAEPPLDTGSGFYIETSDDDAITNYVYNALGRLISETSEIDSSSNAEISYEYDDNGNLVRINDANGKDGFNYYDALNRLTLSVDAEGYATQSIYNSEGELASVTSFENAADLNGVDADNPPTIGAPGSGADIETDAAKDQVTTYTYDDLGRTRGESYALNGSAAADMAYEYDKNGNIVKATDPDGNSSYSYYDALNRLTLSVDAEGHVTETSYNSLGQMERATRYENGFAGTPAVGTPPTIGLPGNGADIETDAAKDQVTTYTYDDLGRVTEETWSVDGNAAYDISSYYAYDDIGNLIKTTDPNGNITYNYYDDLGRVTTSVDGEGYVTKTAYTAFGEIESVTRYETAISTSGLMGGLEANAPSVVLDTGNDAHTSFEYDDLGRVTKSTDALGYYETYTYDAAGNRTSSTNKLGATTTYIYDDRGLLMSETMPGSSASPAITNTFEYDANGNRTKLIEAQGLAEERVTEYVYDANNRLIQTLGEVRTVLDQSDHVTEDTNFIPTETIDYDARGNIIRTEDASGAETFFYYDDANRKTLEITQNDDATSSGTYTAYSYDSNGNILTTKIYEGTVDITGLTGGAEADIPSAIVPDPLVDAHRATSFTYDALDRLIESRVIDVDTGAWVDDGNGNFSYSTASGDLVTLYEYDANGNVVKLTDPNNASIHSYYDALGRKEAQVDAEGYLTTWAYDSDGNVETETRHATQFTGTVSTASAPSVVSHGDDRITEYTYDKVGNRLTEARENVEVHDGSGGTLVVAAATITYEYNGLGQVISKIEAADLEAANGNSANAKVANYVYDSTGRLTSEQKQSFDNYLGQSVTPTVNYIYDGLGNLAQTEQTGNANAAARTTSYTYGAGGLLASMEDASGNIRSYAYDEAGRVIREQYTRTESDGTSHTEAILTSYDVLGRSIEQTVAQLNGGVWNKGDISSTEYNAYGDIAESKVNGKSLGENKYDAAGRLWATNSVDGVWKYFGYDANGNQTIAVTSVGADLTGLTYTQALDLFAGNNINANGVNGLNISDTEINASYTVYNDRNLAIEVTEEGREVDDGTGTVAPDDLTSLRSYNAFGEVTSETNALGNTTDYTYNNIGRVIKKESPQVSMTAENGAVTNERPTEHYYYDASGRLVASKDANGNLTKLTLLAGSGYDGSEALVSVTTDAANYAVTTGFDIHGDARRIYDQLNNPANQNAVYTTQEYDEAGRVTQITKPGGLESYYAYDELGQRIKHTNSVLGSDQFIANDNVETTDYDSQGRVISQIAFGGDETIFTYTWDANISAFSGITTGGWTKVSSYEAGRRYINDGIGAVTESTDLFGRLADKVDMGGQDYDYGYDVAGRVTSETSSEGKNNSFEYYNTGRISEQVSGDLEVVDTDWSNKTATYIYDALGQLTKEKLVRNEGDYTPEQVIELPPLFGGGTYTIPESYEVTTATLQDGHATYNALGWMINYYDDAATGAHYADKTWTHDANGNIRSAITTYREMDTDGSIEATTDTQNYWYKYDSLNRMVTAKGAFVGAAGTGSIQRGTDGISITYDAAGQRATSRTGNAAVETYSYNVDGQLLSVTIGSVTRATTSYDALGRINGHAEKNAFNQLVHERHSIVYGERPGQILSEKGKVKQGSDWVYNHTINNYSETAANSAGNPAVGSAAITTSGRIGTSTGSVLADSKTKYWLNGSVSPSYPGSGSNYSQADMDRADTDTDYIWDWTGAEGGSPLQARVELDDRNSSNQAVAQTDSIYSYDANGHLTDIQITGGEYPRDVEYESDINGQILQRSEVLGGLNYGDDAPHTRSYMFGGRQMGEVTNNGTENITYEQYIANRGLDPDTYDGAFRNGATSATQHADFDAAYQAINGGFEGSSTGSYTVRAGDSLQGIAANVYGDASLWYKIAGANGLSGTAQLTPGSTLTLPAGIVRSTNNASTFKPYDPSRAIGDVAPNTPLPPKGDKGCGVVGAILLVAVAVAVTIATKGAAGKFVGKFLGATLGKIIGGAAAAAFGTAASQGVGIISGHQQDFNLKQIAISGIAAGVSAGIGATGIFGNVADATGKFTEGAIGIKSGIVDAALRGAASNAITQGIARVTGLQDKFSFTGVAVAAIGSAVGYKVGQFVGGGPEYNSEGELTKPATIGYLAATSAARAIAGAATRSAIKGNSFGDSLINAIPDVIGNVIGSAVGQAATARPEAEEKTTSNNNQPHEVTGQAKAKTETGKGGVQTAQANANQANANASGSVQQGVGEKVVQTVKQDTVPSLLPPKSRLAGVGFASAGGTGEVFLATANSVTTADEVNDPDTYLFNGKELGYAEPGEGSPRYKYYDGFDDPTLIKLLPELLKDHPGDTLEEKIKSHGDFVRTTAIEDSAEPLSIFLLATRIRALDTELLPNALAIGNAIDSDLALGVDFVKGLGIKAGNSALEAVGEIGLMISEPGILVPQSEEVAKMKLDAAVRSGDRITSVVSGAKDLLVDTVKMEVAKDLARDGTLTDNPEFFKQSQAIIDSIDTPTLDFAALLLAEAEKGSRFAQGALATGTSAAIASAIITRGTYKFGIARVADRQALKELRNIGGSNSHFVSRHGAGTSLADQQRRAKTGQLPGPDGATTFPNGDLRKPVNASRFLSNRGQLASARLAMQEFAINPTKDGRVTVELPNVIGEGYRKGGNSYVRTNFATAQFNRNTGELITIYPDLDRGN